VVIDREEDLKSSYLFRNDECWVTSGDSEMAEVLDDRNSWYLIDSHQRGSIYEEPVMIFVTWPNLRYFL
jgi:hypothetical protein